MGGTNWGSSSLEWLKKNLFEPVSANFADKFAEVFPKVAFLFQVFADFLKRKYLEPVFANFAVKSAEVFGKVAFLFAVFPDFLKRDFFEPAPANFVVKFAEVFAKVALLFQVFADILKKKFFEPISTKFVEKFADIVPIVATRFQEFADFLNKNFFKLISTKLAEKVAEKLADVVLKVAIFIFLVFHFVRFEWIKKELVWIQGLLKVDEPKHNTVEGVGKWVENVRDVSYQVDDVIDNIDIYFQTVERRRPGVVGQMERFKSQLETRFDFAWQMLMICAKYLWFITIREFYGTIRHINEEGRQEAKSSSTSSIEDHLQFSSKVKETEVVGQQKEIDNLMERLNSEEPSQRRVISIVGMAGSGKTTLAKKVYHDVKKNRFDCRAFITLPRQYKTENILLDILECMMGLPPEEIEKLRQKCVKGLPPEEMDRLTTEIGVKLRDHLKNKRYLVVIEDIRSKKEWDHMLEPILADFENQSRVMLTTRNEEVVPYHPPGLRMRPLDKDEGWELFMKKIFPNKKNLSTACPADLEETGREILAKCGGVPLAILALGGLLASKKKTFTVWSKVLVSVNDILTDRSNDCGEILALCYSELPPYLKPCFLYFGLFPANYEINSEKLIRLWIAEGFIQQKDNEIMEDTAEDYLVQLINRSMIQASEKSNGSIDKCSINGPSHDLAISKATQEKFFTIHNVEGTCSFSTSVRRLALHRNIDGYHLPKTLRSILCFGSDAFSNLKFKQAKLLRVVSQDFMLSSKATLTNELKQFVHLRYLELEVGEEGPPSIGDLNYLQTLVLNKLSGYLPIGISNLKQLRHLDASRSKVGKLQVKNLTNLQTLCLTAGDWIKCDFGNLTNLRELRISGFPSDLVNDKTLADSIEKLLSLRLLVLDGFTHPPQLKPFTSHVHLYKMKLYGSMQELPELPPYLAELILGLANFREDAIAKLEKLSHLKVLNLHYNSYGSKKMIFSPGGFPRLEILVMYGIPLEEWDIAEGAVPSLKCVRLIAMSKLNTETLPERVRSILVREAEH